MSSLKLYTGPLFLILIAVFFILFPWVLAFLVSSLMFLGALFWIRMIYSFNQIKQNMNQSYEQSSSSGQTYDYETGSFVKEEPNFKNVTFIIKQKIDRFY